MCTLCKVEGCKADYEVALEQIEELEQELQLHKADKEVIQILADKVHSLLCDMNRMITMQDSTVTLSPPTKPEVWIQWARGQVNAQTEGKHL